ncbi:MAG TPA: gephyrin-like molybdotransferase Glp [Anaeromyxobacteraceae bacterium]|nr:gephyrin-like molybdotransferase Glp [Anaeromyxobacteraceae bacterium]
MRRVDRVLSIRAEVERAIVPVGAETLPMAEASDRWLAEAARASRAVPPTTCSAMDGYAVRAAEASGGGALSVRQVVYAGDVPVPLGAGEAARIFTGAPLPEGADAVVREEAARVEGGRVRFPGPVRPGENVRQAGEDVQAGGLALAPGAFVGPRQAALLAAVGADPVVVRRRVRVAIVSTGDEVVGGRTPDSNGAALEGLVRGLGAEVMRRAVGDRLEAVREELAGALAACDALVTVGGVSVGERDLVPAALEGVGAAIRVHGVPMKPGKPFLFAMAGEKPAFGLPGSPSACLVAFEVFARPGLLARCGAARRHRPAVRLPLAEAASGKPGRARFLWAVLEEGGRVRPIGRDAAQVRGPSLADALLYVPEGVGDLAAGDEVEAWLLGDGA